MKSYPLDASPTIYSGQVAEMSYVLDEGPDAGDVTITPLLRHYGKADAVVTIYGSPHQAKPGAYRIRWKVPFLDGQPICEIGLSVTGGSGRFFLDALDWSGTPDVRFSRPLEAGSMWRRAWVSETDFDHPDPEEGIRLVSNGSRRLTMTGTSSWHDYRVEAQVTPHAADAFGLAARVQGLRRYYLLRVDNQGEAQLIRRDGDDHVLARAHLKWSPGSPTRLRLDVIGTAITAYIDGTQIASIDDSIHGLNYGGIALACESGRIGFSEVRVSPPPLGRIDDESGALEGYVAA